MTAVFAAQGWGNFSKWLTFDIVQILSLNILSAAALIGFIITAASKSAILADSVQELGSVDLMWRLLLGLGAIPGVVGLYFRLTIPETPRFTMDIERNIHQAAVDVHAGVGGEKSNVDDSTLIQRINVPKASWTDFKEYFGKLENFQVIFGTAYSWFAVDVCSIFYKFIISL